MNDERFYVGRVNRNLKVSVITPNGAVYDMVQQMTRVSRRIEPSQVILINGARKGAKLQIAEAVRSEVVAFFCLGTDGDEAGGFLSSGTGLCDSA